MSCLWRGSGEGPTHLPKITAMAGWGLGGKAHQEGPAPVAGPRAASDHDRVSRAGRLSHPVNMDLPCGPRHTQDQLCWESPPTPQLGWPHVSLGPKGLLRSLPQKRVGGWGGGGDTWAIFQGLAETQA